jgi:hypothetical protein
MVDDVNFNNNAHINQKVEYIYLLQEETYVKQNENIYKLEEHGKKIRQDFINIQKEANCFCKLNASIVFLLKKN